MRRSILCAAVLLPGLVGGCTTAPPTQSERAVEERAVAPSSEDAAQAAVIRYFASSASLKFVADVATTDGARYTFRPVVKGRLLARDAREFGWFVCGTVDLKDRRGGASGAVPFLAHFDPANRDRVLDGFVERSGGSNSVSRWCRGLYGD